MPRASVSGTCRPRTLASLLIAASLVVPAVAAARLSAAPVETSSRAVAHLTDQLRALSPTVSAREANRLAFSAHRASRELAGRYRAAGPPQFHNFLVNAGLKQRGLCHHWARDLGGRLAALELRTLVLRWGIARRGTLREHNAVVVTARGQAFERGVVLDAWRHSGRLFSTPVASDKYPWREDPQDSFAHRGALRR